MGFWGSLFGGQNENLNTDIGATGQLAGWASGTGQNYTNQAGNFFSSILSGDPSKQMQVLAPEINALKTSTSQDQKTATMFAPRSGGTAASNAAASDKAHGYIADLIGKLTGSAAGSLSSMGSNLVNTGLSAYGQNAELSQQQMQNWSDSILGKGITTAAAFGESYGLNSIPGGGGGKDSSV
jgi:hypothetical protein